MAALRFFFYLLMKPATLGMAFLGIAGIFAPSTNPNSWWLPALSGLFMPAIIFANLYLLIFWAICKKWWIILPCVTIICNYNYFTGTFQSPWKKDILYTQENDITIASYNVNGFSWIARNVQYDIKKIVDEVNKISHKAFGEEKDLIGRVYEYFLKEFAVNATKEEGEFYTPHDVVQLIAAMIEPFDGTLYDKTTPRLIQFHTLKNAVNPPFLGGFSIFATVAA